MGSGYSSLGYLIVSTCDLRKVLENLMFGHLQLSLNKRNPQSKLKSCLWWFLLPLYSYSTLKLSSGYHCSSYLIVSTCDMLENLMVGYLHLRQKNRNHQSKLKSWFWDSFPPLYSYWTLKVSSGIVPRVT